MFLFLRKIVTIYIQEQKADTLHYHSWGSELLCLIPNLYVSPYNFLATSVPFLRLQEQRAPDREALKSSSVFSHSSGGREVKISVMSRIIWASFRRLKERFVAASLQPLPFSLHDCLPSVPVSSHGNLFSLSASRFFSSPYEDSDPIGLGPILMTSCELDSIWDTMLSDKVTFTSNRVKTSKYNLGGIQLNLKQCPFFSQAPFSFPGFKFSHRIVICSFFSTSILPIKNVVGLLCIKHCGELMFHAGDREPALVNLLVEGERNNTSQ